MRRPTSTLRASSAIDASHLERGTAIVLAAFAASGLEACSSGGGGAGPGGAGDASAVAPAASEGGFVDDRAGGSTETEAGPADGGGAPPDPGLAPDFGSNVLIFDPSMSMASIQSRIDSVYGSQASNQFGSQRYAYFFKPGQYQLDVQVGFYMQVLGLGASPDDVTITGAVRSMATWFGGNATLNFWRGAENLAVSPNQNSGGDVWAVSQGTHLRRVHVQGPLALSDGGGYSSGGFIADSSIEATVSAGSQQQFFTRNTSLGGWSGGAWNMVFVGDQPEPSGSWPSSPTTSIATTPVVREKPYLVIDAAGKYSVTVPGLKKSSQGPSWAGAGGSPGASVPIGQFYVAHAGSDTAETMNAALGGGKHLLLTPGIYHLDKSLQVSRAGTIVLGLGMPTLVPDNATAVMQIADVDGVSVGGILLDAGPSDSPSLLVVGTAGSRTGHAQNPSALFDLHCRVGGEFVGTADTCVTIHSSDVITDNTWMWRADHGAGAAWSTNKSLNGLVVNGSGVTAYGLFVEHFQQYQTLWNGNGGRTYFYQSEMPYDPPSQSAWRPGTVNGYASYKVADTVTSHDAWGLGVYCAFRNPVVADNAVESPPAAGVTFHHMVTELLGPANGSAINHIINGTGAAVNSGNTHAVTPY